MGKQMEYGAVTEIEKMKPLPPNPNAKSPWEKAQDLVAQTQRLPGITGDELAGVANINMHAMNGDISVKALRKHCRTVTQNVIRRNADAQKKGE